MGEVSLHQTHLQPFVDGKSLPCSYTYFGEERRQWFYVKDSENELFDKAEKVIHFDNRGILKSSS